MHPIDVFQHTFTNAVHIGNPREQIEGLARRHQLVKNTCLGGNLLLPGNAILFGFDDGPDDLLDAFVEQVNLGDSGAHDGRVVFAEPVGVGLEIFVNASNEQNVGFILADGLHEPLQDVL